MAGITETEANAATSGAARWAALEEEQRRGELANVGGQLTTALWRPMLEAAGWRQRAYVEQVPGQPKVIRFVWQDPTGAAGQAGYQQRNADKYLPPAVAAWVRAQQGAT